ncbi:hypothetical protein B0I37DRAFT_362930 [Chaetomium sp. MPI-CAGE-AT-0009]|nr:hypothetical protein B0I37DRAFT_362930 [Chaetomium sp. MPI-CAGE-AT-0009]
MSFLLFLLLSTFEVRLLLARGCPLSNTSRTIRCPTVSPAGTARRAAVEPRRGILWGSANHPWCAPRAARLIR